MKEAKLLVLLLLVAVVAVVYCESSSEWQLLTKQNFSSQIRRNPYILLFITLPWSGESRSLMKEVAHAVSDRQQEEFRSLKLMFMFRNMEKMLADAIIAAASAPPNEEEETTILFYLHSVSYKYRGPFRALNILSSLLPYISNSNSSSNQPQLPLLNTPDHLNSFLASTDKALLLLEFCGWTPKLLANHNTNPFGVGAQDLLGNNFNAEANQTLADTRKNNQKGMKD